MMMHTTFLATAAGAVLQLGGEGRPAWQPDAVVYLGAMIEVPVETLGMNHQIYCRFAVLVPADLGGAAQADSRWSQSHAVPVAPGDAMVVIPADVALGVSPAEITLNADAGPALPPAVIHIPDSGPTPAP